MARLWRAVLGALRLRCGLLGDLGGWLLVRRSPWRHPRAVLGADTEHRH